jgi:hypothetical protein
MTPGFAPLRAALTIAAACLSAAVCAQAAWSGDDLYKGLTAWKKGTPEQQARAAQAYAYMLEVAESRNFAPRDKGGFRYCMPEITTRTSVELTVLNWLERNPGRRKADASGLIVQALSERYPCRH